MIGAAASVCRTVRSGGLVAIGNVAGFLMLNLTQQGAQNDYRSAASNHSRVVLPGRSAEQTLLCVLRDHNHRRMRQTPFGGDGVELVGAFLR